MSEWTIITVIATLVGLIASVVRPLISLNNTITRLTEIVRELEKNISGLTAKNSESHAKLWEKNCEQDDMLADHETRITVIEKQNGKVKT